MREAAKVTVERYSNVTRKQIRDKWLHLILITYASVKD